MSYVPLWCKSNFSFLEGASHPDELVQQAHALGIPALALTDRDGVQGMVRAHVKARELGVSLIVGAEVTIGPEVTDADRRRRCSREHRRYAGAHFHLRAARDEPGRLCQPLSVDHHRPAAAAEGRVMRDLAGSLRAGAGAHRALGRRPEPADSGR